VHAMWTLTAMPPGQPFDGKRDLRNHVAAITAAALKHPSAAVKRTAAQTLPRAEASLHRIGESGIFDDTNAQVRLAALLASAEISGHRTIAQSFAAMATRPENLDDRALFDALVVAAANYDHFFLTAVAITKKPLDPRARRIVEIVAEHFARRAPTK